MGLYVLKASSHKLTQMNFEDILNEITEMPKELLCTEGVLLQIVKAPGGEESFDKIEQEGNLTLYEVLRRTFNESQGSSLISFHLERLN